MSAMTSRASRHAVRRVAAAVAAVLAVLLVVTGCGTASEPSPPAGVDGLTVPTPSADPRDFVDEVDNPWLPLVAGDSWTYRTADGADEVWSVEPGPQVAGVPTTALVTGGGVTDYFAQDEDGNVWWFGREGEWRAGDGAEAGIAMLATPRVGDGYLQAEPGPRAEIVALDGVAETGAGAFDDLLVIETTEPDGRVLRTYYARGAGPVSRETVTGTPDETLDLVGRS
jgi:hypothetical protein